MINGSLRLLVVISLKIFIISVVAVANKKSDRYCDDYGGLVMLCAKYKLAWAPKLESDVSTQISRLNQMQPSRPCPIANVMKG